MKNTITELTYLPFFGIPYSHDGGKSALNYFSNYSLNKKFSKMTNDRIVKKTTCKYCGNEFLYRQNQKIETRQFCSSLCANRYFTKLRKEMRLKKIFTETDFKDFAKFKKLYEGYITAEINKYESEYRFIMLDLWESQAPIMYAKLGTSRKQLIYNYAKRFVYFWYLTAKNKKKEIYFAECPAKIQQAIYGNYEEV